MGQEDLLISFLCFFAGIYLLKGNSCHFPSQAADLEAWQAGGSSWMAT